MLGLWNSKDTLTSRKIHHPKASGISCSLFDYAGCWNNTNRTNVSHSHSLQLLSTADYYIYGLAVNGITLHFWTTVCELVVTSSSFVLLDNQYSWTISTYRFGTSAYLETNGYNSGPIVRSDLGSSCLENLNWVPGKMNCYAVFSLGNEVVSDIDFTPHLLIFGL